MTLKVGEQISVPASNVQKYSEGQKGIVEVRLPDDGEEFIIVGVRAGVSSLLLIKEDGEKITYLFEVKALANEVVSKENIRLDFYFVELTSGGQFQVGVSWPGSISSEVALDAQIATGGLSEATATLTSLALPRLDMLHRTNWAKVASKASLITANGEQAEFNSGGEVNIVVAGSLAAELRQIPFGTNIKVLPRFDKESGRLEVRVQADVSSLGEGEIPSRSRSTISTTVNVEMNQAIVLAGLHSKSEAKNRVGLPFLSQIPVIGALFGSHGSRKEEVQNVIFIVPSIVDVVGSDARSQIQEALKAYDGYSGELGSVSVSPPAKESP